jgi:hypothetical protein
MYLKTTALGGFNAPLNRYKMGWHYILHVTCKVLPEYHDFIDKKYLWLFSDVDDGYKPTEEYSDDSNEDTSSKSSVNTYELEQQAERKTAYANFTKAYRDLVDIWTSLELGHHFQEYEFENGIFSFVICKKVTWHNGDLKKDYEAFLRDILVPITSEITSCEIESDDFGDYRQQYTDTELRNTSFNLRDLIKTIQHTYNEDQTEILETRVVYKRSIKRLQFEDLNREYRGRR